MARPARRKLLILSQVVLSLQLPFAVVPLVMFTADKRKMGALVAPYWVTALAVLVAIAVIALNMKLLWDFVARLTRHDAAGFAGDQIRMRAFPVLAASLCCGLSLLIPAAEAADPAKPYLGMSKEAILACAGEPYGKYKSGSNAETLTYHYSGAGPVPGPPGQKNKKKQGGLGGFFAGGEKADTTDKKDKTEPKADQSGDAPDQTEHKEKTADASEAGSKGGKGGKKNKKKDSGWTCTASLVFEDGTLARVSFAHKDVRSPYDWQKEKNPKRQEELRNAPLPTCTFSLPNCTRAQQSSSNLNASCPAEVPGIHESVQWVNRGWPGPARP